MKLFGYHKSPQKVKESDDMFSSLLLPHIHVREGTG